MALTTLSRKPVGKGGNAIPKIEDGKPVLSKDGKPVMENQPISYQGFAVDGPLPTTQELIDACGGNDELFRRVARDGFNDYSFEQVADPIAKYVKDAWSDEETANFKASVRAMAKVLGGIDNAANLLLANMQ